MRDEEVSQAKLCLQILEQIHHLRLGRHVERRHRFVCDDEARIERERPRDADPLPLATGQFMREALCVLAREADGFQEIRHSILTRAAIHDALHRSGSATISPMGIRGSNDE